MPKRLSKIKHPGPIKEMKNMTEPIKAGDTISVHYTGKFESGEVFDSSESRPPLKFTVGTGQMIKGFDAAVLGMMPGDKKTVTVTSADGYGERREEMVMDMPRGNIPKDMELSENMAVQLSDNSGNPVPAVVVELGESTVKIDANHPLAGKTLVFDIEIAETGLAPDPQCSPSACGSCGGTCG
jgi:peptidylprolyl isomerase